MFFKNQLGILVGAECGYPVLSAASASARRRWILRECHPGNTECRNKSEIFSDGVHLNFLIDFFQDVEREQASASRTRSGSAPASCADSGTQSQRRNPRHAASRTIERRCRSRRMEDW